jgi:predicted O-methyltransferase YrrM
MQTRDKDASIQYITETFVTQPPAFLAAREKGEQLRPGMQISPYEGHLLGWLTRMSQAKNQLEIGSFVGYSTLWQASALPENGHITTLEINPEHAAHTRNHAKNAGLDAKITVHEGDAIAFIKHYTGAPFDYVFIDGVKKDYPLYLELLMPHLTENAWIIADNSLLFGAFTQSAPREKVSKTAYSAMQKFHQTMASRDNFDAVMIPTLEGLIVAKRKTK